MKAAIRRCREIYWSVLFICAITPILRPFWLSYFTSSAFSTLTRLLSMDALTNVFLWQSGIMFSIKHFRILYQRDHTNIFVSNDNKVCS